MGEWKLTYEYVLEQNKDLKELARFCDSIRTVDDKLIKELTSQTRIQNHLILNKNMEIEQWEGKFKTAEDQVKIERRKKRIYQLTTGLALALTVTIGVLSIR